LLVVRKNKSQISRMANYKNRQDGEEVLNY
jgi:hypothetical protein